MYVASSSDVKCDIVVASLRLAGTAWFCRNFLLEKKSCALQAPAPPHTAGAEAPRIRELAGCAVFCGTSSDYSKPLSGYSRE